MKPPAIVKTSRPRNAAYVDIGTLFLAAPAASYFPKSFAKITSFAIEAPIFTAVTKPSLII